jgi:hypothetical protein
MPDFQDLWYGINALKTSPLMVIALPMLVATVFASIVDWVESYIGRSQETTSRHLADEACASARQTHSRRVTPNRSPIFGVSGHPVEGS